LLVCAALHLLVSVNPASLLRIREAPVAIAIWRQQAGFVLQYRPFHAIS
jgi:hypothetical protein